MNLNLLNPYQIIKELTRQIEELKAENEQLREKAGVTDDTVERRSDGQETDGRVAFNPILGSAIVTPANATNADKVTITSDDPEGTVAYYTNGEKAYIPKQAGTVTFTATIEDTDPTTGKTNTISGDSTVTFVYKNNVESVELADTDKEIAKKQ